MQTRSLKLEKGDDVLLSLHTFAKNTNTNSFVLGVVGNLTRAVFQCPDRSDLTKLEGNLEVITLNGTISPERPHLHLSVSDNDCKVWGGHLETGSLVFKGLELLIGIINEGSRNRIDDEIENKPRIEVFVLPNCPWCARTIRILKSKNISYKLFNVDDEDSFRIAREKSGSSLFPQVYIDNIYLGGYEDFSKFANNHNLDNFTSIK